MFSGSIEQLIPGMHADDTEVFWYPGKHLKLRPLFICIPVQFYFMSLSFKPANVCLRETFM